MSDQDRARWDKLKRDQKGLQEDYRPGIAIAKRPVSYEFTKSILGDVIPNIAFVCEGFRIKPLSELSDFAHLNKLDPALSTTIELFVKVRAIFEEDFEILASHFALTKRNAIMNGGGLDLAFELIRLQYLRHRAGRTLLRIQLAK